MMGYPMFAGSKTTRREVVLPEDDHGAAVALFHTEIVGGTSADGCSPSQTASGDFD